MNSLATRLPKVSKYILSKGFFCPLASTPFTFTPLGSPQSALLYYIQGTLLTCHFLTKDLSLSVVMVIPWKFVSTFLPWMSSDINLNFRKATSSFCRSARDTSNTRPLRPSLASSDERQIEMIILHLDPTTTFLQHSSWNWTLTFCTFFYAWWVQCSLQVLQKQKLTFPLCSGDEGLSDVSNSKHGGGFHIVPVLLCEGVHTGREEREEGKEGEREVAWTCTYIKSPKN